MTPFVTMGKYYLTLIIDEKIDSSFLEVHRLSTTTYYVKILLYDPICYYGKYYKEDKVLKSKFLFQLIRYATRYCIIITENTLITKTMEYGILYIFHFQIGTVSCNWAD